MLKLKPKSTPTPKDSDKEEMLRNLTLKQFLANPSGKNTAYLANRQRTIMDLKERFSAMMALQRVFPTTVYYNEALDSYTFHIKVPSEQKDLSKKIYYDTIIEFLPPSDGISNTTSLLSYNIRIWSNSPAFTFTYLYTAHRYNLVPDWIKPKSSSVATSTPSKIKNPVEVMGFEKSLNFAGNYIIYKEYYRTGNIKLITRKFKLTTILKEISSSDLKIKEYNTALNKVRVAKAAEKKKKIKGTTTTVRKVSYTLKSRTANSSKKRRITKNVLTRKKK